MKKIEQKNKNMKIRKLERVYQEIFTLQRAIEDFWKSIPIPLCSTNSILNILEIGESFKNTFGYLKKEIVGENLNKIFQEKKDYEKIKEKLFQEGELKGEEIVLISKAGKKILTNVYAKPKRDGKGRIVGYIFSFLDISEKKKVEKKLQQKLKDLQKFTKELKDSRTALLNILEDIEEAREIAEVERDKTLAIIENFPEGLLFFDREGKLFSLNPKAQEFFNLSPQELLGKTLKELSQIYSLAFLIKILEENWGRTLREELKLKENLILEISTISVKRKDKKIGILVILRDITREKLIERLKTEFVSIAAHQLRTPLSAIKWTLRMILDGDIGEISSEQREFLERSYRSNERMIRLINDLLNVTRIEEGRFIYNLKTQDIVKVAEGVITSLKEIAQKKGIDFQFELTQKRIPLAQFDAEKIALVFQNLIDNAINYTPKGGKVKVELNYLEEKKEILVKVRDTGIGIPEDQQKRVFSRFFRGANAIRAETEGTGLGLYIAKNIVEAHRGRIWFESKENYGSTFYFTLPVKEAVQEFLEKF